MLRGRFGDTSGRPYLEGRLIFPKLNIQSNLLFCVDTGADHCLLTPTDGQRMHLDYTKLNEGIASIGIGGRSRNFVEPAWITFADPGRTLYLYELDLMIAAPGPDIADIPSVLGRDILNRWRMFYNYQSRRLTFGVLSADFAFPQ